MADSNYTKFADRLRQINANHHQMAGGFVEFVERDGILIPKPVRRRRHRRGFPLRGLMITVGAFLMFKGFLLAQLGPITYQSRLDKLAEGGAFEQIAVWVMYADPITAWIAEQLGRVI